MWTNFFAVWPPPPMALPVPLTPLFSSIGGVYWRPDQLYLQAYPQPNGLGNSITSTPPIQVLFEGMAPGQIGVQQINFVVPANQPPGDWALFFNIDNATFLTGAARSSPYAKLPVR